MPFPPKSGDEIANDKYIDSDHDHFRDTKLFCKLETSSGTNEAVAIMVK